MVMLAVPRIDESVRLLFKEESEPCKSPKSKGE